MTHHDHDHDDRDDTIRRLFAAARQADRDDAPGFDEILNRERAAARTDRGRTLGRRFTPALAVAASLAIVAAAGTLLLRPAPEQAAPVEVALQRDERPVPVPPPPAPGADVAEEAGASAPAEVQAAPEPPPRAAERAIAPAPPPSPEAESVPVTGERAEPEVEAAPAPPPPVQLSPKMEERVKVTAMSEVMDLEPSQSSTRSSEDFIADLPVPGRFYQNVLTMAPGVQDADGGGNPNVHGSRSRGFKAIVGGLSKVDPLTGQFMSNHNPNSIEELDVITSGAGVESGRAQGGFPGPAPMARQARQAPVPPIADGLGPEGYDHVEDNGFRAVTDEPLSTFSIDVDTAAYANVRRFLNAGQRPPADAVRIEELVNYFRYDYPEPAGDVPFAVHAEVMASPWDERNRLLRLGLRGRDIDRGETAGSNLVFLIDVSGSMNSLNKLPLLKESLVLLADQLDGRDQVAIVVYAGASGLVLPSTSGSRRAEIRQALGRLQAGGSTNGAAGLRLAYQTARDSFIEGGVNRVILATDGDFNVGVTSKGDLLELIREDARKGIYLTVLGFGMGNYQDGMLETLTGKGNGNYAYIDTRSEAHKVLVEQLAGTLITIAKDVKIQIEFNPAEVGAYRLIGYENRVMANQDFNDDTKDAGEIGAGHTVTALYELTPPGAEAAAPAVDPLKYQTNTAPTDSATTGELATVKLRYKLPDEETSTKIDIPVVDGGLTVETASPDTRFAAAVAAFGMLLRDSEHRGTADWELVRRLASSGLGADASGRRGEFLDLVRQAAAMHDGR